jgi:hypothetical protein
MFSEMIAAIRDNVTPELISLQKRYDFALTKKLGIVKLPPAFWMQDPKINPRSDHLFWAALLLKDRTRIDMALSVIAVELTEAISPQEDGYRQRVDNKACELVEKLLEQFTDVDMRQQFEQELHLLIPEWMALTCGKPK